MEPVVASIARWAVPLWCAVVLLVAMWWLRKRGRRKLGVACGVLAAIAAFPLPNLSAPRQVPTQVIYRFDDHRYLELTGYRCEGALWYVDLKRQIRTQLTFHSYRLFLKPFIHPSERYIAVPLSDLSAIMVSTDYGRTFRDSAYGTDFSKENAYPGINDVKRFVVVNDQGFLELNNGRLYESSKPLETGGDNWGFGYVDPLEVHKWVYAEYPEFQNLPTSTPEVKDYTGWTRMDCDLSKGAVPEINGWQRLQGVVYDIEAATLGAPMYFGLRALAQRGDS